MYSKHLLAALLSFLLAVTLSGCKKSKDAAPSSPLPVSPTAPATVTSGIGGVRNWHGSHSYHASGIHFPTPVNEFSYFPDTSFAVGIVNDSTIQFLGNDYAYDQTDSVKQIRFFGTAWTYYTYHSGTGVAYYYVKDSIVYCHGDVHGTSDSWTLSDLYYTY